MTLIEWFTTPNPLLGGVSPIWMIKTGRGKRLLQFIENLIDDNFKDGEKYWE